MRLGHIAEEALAKNNHPLPITLLVILHQGRYLPGAVHGQQQEVTFLCCGVSYDEFEGTCVEPERRSN